MHYYFSAADLELLYSYLHNVLSHFRITGSQLRDPYKLFHQHEFIGSMGILIISQLLTDDVESVIGY